MNKKITIVRLFYEMSKANQLKDKDIKIYIQNYLHYIKRIREKENTKLIENLFACEPKKYSKIPIDVYAYVAAFVEIITTEMGIATPLWTENKFYFLEEPWFPQEVYKYPKIMETLRELSPEAFKRRNLFVSENAISVM